MRAPVISWTTPKLGVDVAADRTHMVVHDVRVVLVGLIGQVRLRQHRAPQSFEHGLGSN